jgi:predicted esterase
MLQSHIVSSCSAFRAAAVASLLVLSAGSLRAQEESPFAGQIGWRSVDLSELGSRFDRYLPQGVDTEAGAPLVVFLHNTGRDLSLYRDSLQAAADQLRLVVALPVASSPRGWGFGSDLDIVERTIVTVAAEIAVRPGKVAIAGHGSGASYAYLLAYLTELRLSAVFTMSAPYLPVSAVLNPRYAPAIRMYYGAADPTLGRDGPKLRQQWDFLGLEWEEDVRSGFGLSTWPLESVLDGFRFLVDRAAPTDSSPPCTSGTSSLCLHQGRFLAEVSFKESANQVGRGTVAAPRTKDSGLFWFYEPSNWELLVKVLDGCAVNGRYWVFASASTSLDFRITVTDLAANQTVQYRHWFGEPVESVADVGAFATCGEPFP